MILSNLNIEQEHVVRAEGNILISACPGSGKTRVLTRRIAYELTERLDNNKQMVAALTFTNRAADEIKQRIDNLNIDSTQLWAGTIHVFCLEWILRPYAGLLKVTKKGFSIIDPHEADEIILGLKEKHNYGIKPFKQINTRFNRNGYQEENGGEVRKILNDYYRELCNNKKVNFDLILFYSYKILDRNPETAKALSNVFKLICIDEYQDTQDLQYDILCKIAKSGKGKTTVFFAGDPNQAIFSTLGGVAKTTDEIKDLSGLEIVRKEIGGTYRSTQRLADYYRNFQVEPIEVKALGKYANLPGAIYHTHGLEREELLTFIANLIKFYLEEKAIPPKEICVLAPRWYIVAPTGRRLKALLPKISFDAYGLSPFRKSRENFWYKVTQLFLVEPSSNMLRTRLRWAREFREELVFHNKGVLSDDFSHPRKILRTINSISPREVDGIEYLKQAFRALMQYLEIDYQQNPQLLNLWESFFKGAENILEQEEYANIGRDIKTFKRLFRRSEGVVVNTCQGIKGEEYEVVIAIGILQGMIPHWDVIYNDPQNSEDNAKKLLYVISSRAKRFLHLISQNHRTRRGDLYNPTEILDNLNYRYDQLGTL